MSWLQAVGFGAVGWPEDDLADGVGQGVEPQALVSIGGAEQLGIVFGQPGEQRRALEAEAGFGVEGSDD